VLVLQLLKISVGLSVALSGETAEQFKWNFNSMSKQKEEIVSCFN